MTEDEMRAKFLGSTVCKDCGVLPRNGRKHRCYWCELKSQGTDAEVSAAEKRKNDDDSDFPANYDIADIQAEFAVCCFCSFMIPVFYMKTKKKCRGCWLGSQRDSRDLKTYGVEAGTRQAWAEAQKGCWGCQKQQRFTGLAMHHDHQTGKPYFLACKRCNQDVLGSANDDPQILLRLALGMIYPPHEPGNMELILLKLADLGF